MQIKKMKIKELQAAKYNPRKDLQPGDPEFEKLKRSIQKFGYVELIVVNTATNNTVVSGHQRLNVLKHLGEEEVECVQVEMDEQSEKALNIAMNKISGEWDIPSLTELLQDLNDSDFDVTLTGFDIAEISELFDEASEIQEPGMPDIDPQEPPITKLGDIWELGPHRLMCGDSTSVADLEALTEGREMDLLVTDPPYNIDYEGGTKDHLKIINDKMESESFFNFLVSVFTAIRKVLKKAGPFYIWHASTETLNFTLACERALGKVRQTLIWNKNSFTLGRQDYQWKHEPCLYGWTGGKGAHYFTYKRNMPTVLEVDGIKNIDKMSKAELKAELKAIYENEQAPTTVIDENKPARSAEHPTMKPVKLIARQVMNSSKMGDAVLDTFGGSGSTMMACQQLDRDCYTMELDPHYCDVIIARWEKFTGDKAVLLKNNLKETSEDV